jgi:hypothetical protein
VPNPLECPPTIRFVLVYSSPQAEIKKNRNVRTKNQKIVSVQMGNKEKKNKVEVSF